jgi:ankyrin repeat protein
VIQNNKRVVEALVEGGADVDSISWVYARAYDYDNHMELTPLMLAIDNKLVRLVEYLLDKGAAGMGGVMAVWLSYGLEQHVWS